MSITQALSNAVAGLNVATRASTTISSNVANALDPAYARREVEIGSVIRGAVGSGARVISVTRAIDAALTTDRRLAQASAAEEDTAASWLKGLEEVIGSSDSTGSLTGRIAALEAALTSAASLPQSESRLQTVFDQAAELAEKINEIGTAIQDARTQADADIAKDVTQLNDSLADVKDLNDLIYARSAAGQDVNDLLDARQKLVDGIAAILPVKEAARDGGRIALYTESGTMLVDSRAVTFGFDAAPAVTAGMVLGSGPGNLSGLTIDGRAVDTASSSGAIAGGRLAANFAIRDQAGVQQQDRLDGLARNLVDRFADPATDATLAGRAGLFTDGGTALSTGSDTGLAQRLAINLRADPSAGGDITRLRDGLWAASAGEAGDARGLNALTSALTRSTAAPTGSTGLTGDFASFSSSLLSAVATGRLRAEERVSFLSARADTLQERELARGVNQDDEMQKLLLVEKAYAANAKVLQTVDAMLATLLEI